MEITKELNCPATYVYDQIINSVIYDIKKQTGNYIKREHLKDFTYTKQFGNGTNGTITILEQIPNKRYMFETKTAQNTFISGYQFTAIDEFHCRIDFKEELHSNGIMQKINDILMRVLFEHGKKNNFLQMLEQIEEKYQKDRIREDIDHLKNDE